MSVVNPEGDGRAAADASLPKACPSCGSRFAADALFCALDGSPLTTSPAAIAALAATDPYIGREIVGPIEIRQLVGIGAMGRVYRGFQKGIDRDVAVKILHRELSASPTVVARFHREAKVASRLAHPHVVHVLLTGQLPDGAMYIVMEYLDGLSLQSALAASGGTLPLSRALHVALALCDAAGEAHAQGIVHRDLKPENVMLVKRTDDPDFVKVLDFGIARLNWGDQSTGSAAGLIFGTARYISPEGARGETVGPPGDVYAIATMLYQMLAGRTPFDAEQAVALLVHQIHDPPPPLKSIAQAAHVPGPIEAAIMGNLAKKPEDRAENARAFGRTLLDAAVASGLRAQDILGRPTMAGVAQNTQEPVRAPVRTEIAEHAAAVPRTVAPTWSPPPDVDATMNDHRQPAPTPAPTATVAPGTRPGDARSGPRGSGRAAAIVVAFFLVGALGAAGIAARTGFLAARHAQPAPLADVVSRANDALIHGRWDSPPGDNVRDITKDGLARWANEGQLLRIRALACNDVVKAARARREEGSIGEALRLAKLAYQLDPSDDVAQRLAAEMESQAQAPPSDSVPPLASGRPPTPPTMAASVAAKATIDASNPKPGVGQPVDFSARVVGPSGPGSRPKVEGALFRISGPGIAPGTSLDAVDDGSGLWRATFTFLQGGRFEVAFVSRADGAPVRAIRVLQVGSDGEPKAQTAAGQPPPGPPPPATPPTAPAHAPPAAPRPSGETTAPSSSAKWL
jgi:serine/threonine-protein kinase